MPSHIVQVVVGLVSLEIYFRGCVGLNFVIVNKKLIRYVEFHWRR